MCDIANIYEQQSSTCFNELKLLVESKPKGFVQMLEAKGKKKQPACILKYAYLLQWINEVLPEEAKSLQTREKCWWILNGLSCFPRCLTCGKAIRSSQFLNVVHGYRKYCCIQCAHKSEEHSRHLSESQKDAFEKDPSYYKKKAEKSKKTRIQKHGAYASMQSLEKRKRSINEKVKADPCYWKKLLEKRELTNIRNGHPSSWNNSKKAVKTRYEKNNGVWETDSIKRKRRNTSLASYGVDDPNRSNVVKKHKAEAFEDAYGKGITCYFQTQSFKQHMKSINEQRKEKERATKKKRGTFNSSKQEEDAYHILHFMYPHLLRQHSSEKYPFNCDFYDPTSDTYIECNFCWTHGGHWFDENDKDDLQKAGLMKAKHSRYYDNAVETWTKRDVKKLAYAQKNDLNYVVFWKIEEVMTYVLDKLQKCSSKCK